MTEQELMQAAVQGGFLNAIAIKPAHMIYHPNCPIVVIPEDAELFVDSMGNLCFKQKGTNITSFKEEGKDYGWAGIVYYYKSGQWAEIMKYAYHTKAMEKDCFEGRYLKVVDDKCIQHYGVRNGDYLLYSYTNELGHQHWGDVEDKKYYYGYKAHTNKYFELMPEGWSPARSWVTKEPPVLQELSIFPSEGVCWKPTKELRDYLLARDNTSTTACGYHVKGIAWNYNSCWEVATYSGKPEYDIKQLEPFIQAAVVRQRVGKHPQSSLMERPLTPEECFFPEKWCIKVDEENNVEVSAFLFREKDKFIGFTNLWCPLAYRYYFHYPQWEPGIRQTSTAKEGYTEITFEQFKKHVLTHTDKQIINENQLKLNQDGQSREFRESSGESNKGESCKVQRPHLSIRGGSEIRATSIRCSKVKIQVGDGYSSDSL